MCSITLFFSYLSVDYYLTFTLSLFIIFLKRSLQKWFHFKLCSFLSSSHLSLSLSLSLSLWVLLSFIYTLSLCLFLFIILSWSTVFSKMISFCFSLYLPLYLPALVGRIFKSPQIYGLLNIFSSRNVGGIDDDGRITTKQFQNCYKFGEERFRANSPIAQTILNQAQLILRIRRSIDRCNQCDKIEQFLIIIGDKFSFKSSPNVG